MSFIDVPDIAGVHEFYQHPEDQPLDVERMLEKTSFSIVIPARNEEKKIGKLLETLSKELTPNMDAEIVIANNSDPGDRTEEVLNEFKSRYPYLNVRLINTERGVSNARNGGAAEANGEYIFYLDADAQFESGFIKRSLLHMLGNGLDAAGFKLIADSDHPVERSIAAVTNAYTQSAQHTSTPVCTAVGFLVKRKTLNRVGGFNPNMNFGEDTECVQRIVKSGKKFGIIPENIVFDMSRVRSIGRANFIGAHIKNAVYYVLTGNPSPEMTTLYKRDRKGKKYS